MPPRTIPSNEAINLLSLDGGGVRGVSSLVILDQFMKKIRDMYGLDEVPKPCEYFHMIAGTSTGGLIAIMLGRLRMSTKEALDAYDNCAAKIFSSKNRKLVWKPSSRFRATTLRKVVEDLVEERGMGEEMRDPDKPNKGKVLVCVLPRGKPSEFKVIRSFRGDEGVDDNWDEDIKIWEAARATTAATSFFKPQKLGSGATAQLYVDAAIGVNNPVEYLLTEAINEFGTNRRFGCVVSIGTGTRELQMNDTRGTVGVLKSKITDSEERHRQMQTKLVKYPGSYYRFNVPEAADRVRLHHYKKIPLLKSLTANYLANRDVAKQVREIAEALETDVFAHRLTLGALALDSEHVFLADTTAQVMGMATAFFTGREDILQRLDFFFSPRNTGGKPRREFLLYGLGGVGKTEVAVKFSEVFEDRFKYIFYLDGSLPATILQSYATIATRYNLGAGGTPEQMKTQVMRWMEELTEEWLMIFDDCNLGDRRGYLPGRGKGNIIFTSRTRELVDGLPPSCTLEVGPFDETAAVGFLLRATGREDASPESEDRNTAEAIVQELGCLPLALDKAAASIRSNRWPLHVYLEQLRARKVGVLTGERFKNKIVENPAVYATLELSYEAILARRRREGRGGRGHAATLALKLLGLLSFYHHASIPLVAIFVRAATERAKLNTSGTYPLRHMMDPRDWDFDGMLHLNTDGQWDAHYVGTGLKVLESYSLIRRDASQSDTTLDASQSDTELDGSRSDTKLDGICVTMHILVHKWARHRMEEEEYERYALLSRIVLTESLRVSDKLLDIRFAHRLGPHVSECLRRKSSRLIAGYEEVLQYKTAYYNHVAKNFSEAEKGYNACLRTWRLDQGNHSWVVIFAWRRLGMLLHEMERLGDAELVYLEVMERVLERIQDYDDALLAAQHGPRRGPRFGTTRWPSRFWMEVSMRLRKSSATRLAGHISRNFRMRVLPNPSGIDVSVNHGTAGPGERCLPDGASALRPESPDDSDSDAGSDDPLYLRAMLSFARADLARVYMDQDRFDMGKKWLIHVLEDLEELEKEAGLAHDQAEILRIEHEVKSLTEPANWKFWKKRLHDVLEFPRGVDGGFYETDAVFHLVAAVADCMLKNCVWEEAYEMYRIALVQFQSIYGPSDKRVLKILRRMVDCRVEDNKCDEAIEIATDCLQRARHAYGESHRETVLTLEKLYEAHYYRILDNDEAMDELLQDALVRAEAGLGSNHSITKRVRKRWQRTRRSLKSPAGGGETIGKILETGNLRASWESLKAIIDDLKARYGPDYMLVKRFAPLIKDGPATTKKEHTARLLATFGPHSSLTKEALKDIQEGPVQDAEPDAQDASPNAGDSRPPLELCICGEAAHAEGSGASNITEVADQHHGVDEADVGEASTSTTLETVRALESEYALRLTGKDDGRKLSKRGAFRNQPVYICGLYH